MSGKMSRDKGKRGERELSKALTELLGVECRRGQQYNGIEGQDVVGVDGLHIESKWVERLNVRAAYEQADRDAGPCAVPVVCHKRNGKPWLITMALDEIINFATAISMAQHNAWKDSE
jgi:Holliday junction resolvase